MKGFLGKTAFLATLIYIVGSPTLSQAALLTKNVGLGATDPQVLDLQKILNTDSATRIALSGTGSSGNETSFFGSLTQKAVIKFQEKYASEILIPAGLARGNGYVGPLTLKKLNQVAAGGQPATSGTVTPLLPIGAQNQQNKPLVSQSSDILESEKIDIYVTDKKMEALQKKITENINMAISSSKKPELPSSLYATQLPVVLINKFSANSGQPGMTLIVSGSGFSTSNTVYFGSSYVVRNVPSAAGKMITLQIPSIPVGRYDVVVKNGSGISNTQIFIVTAPTSPKVTISKVSQSSLKYGQSITIYGTGFTKTNNQITTTLGILKGIPSSDGKSLTVTFEPETFKAINQLGMQNRSYPVSIMVINDNGYGVMENAFTFTY